MDLYRVWKINYDFLKLWIWTQFPVSSFAKMPIFQLCVDHLLNHGPIRKGKSNRKRKKEDGVKPEINEHQKRRKKKEDGEGGSIQWLLNQMTQSYFYE
jgi:hypothetical protein